MRKKQNLTCAHPTCCKTFFARRLVLYTLRHKQHAKDEYWLTGWGGARFTLVGSFTFVYMLIVLSRRCLRCHQRFAVGWQIRKSIARETSVSVLQYHVHCIVVWGFHYLYMRASFLNCHPSLEEGLGPDMSNSISLLCARRDEEFCVPRRNARTRYF